MTILPYQEGVHIMINIGRYSSRLEAYWHSFWESSRQKSNSVCELSTIVESEVLRYGDHHTKLPYQVNIKILTQKQNAVKRLLSEDKNKDSIEEITLVKDHGGGIYLPKKVQTRKFDEIMAIAEEIDLALS